jgi:hypothetical protein
MMKKYLLASDFDQTLSFNDSGIVLSELLGVNGFAEKAAGLSRLNLVHRAENSPICSDMTRSIGASANRT